MSDPVEQRPLERPVMRDCWGGCGAHTECHPDTGYCPPCQTFHEECLASWDNQRKGQRSGQQINHSCEPPYALVLATSAGDIDELAGFLSESDWQDALHPNEGCR